MKFTILEPARTVKASAARNSDSNSGPKRKKRKPRRKPRRRARNSNT